MAPVASSLLMNFQPSRLTVFARYGIAVGLSLAMVAIRAALQPMLGDILPLQLLTFAVLISAWWGGLGPGLLATGLCAIAGDFFFLPPKLSFAVPDVEEAIHLPVFICIGAAISAMAEALHRAARREQAQREALRVNEERLRLAILATEDAVWDWDVATNLLGWSPAVAERFGWDDAPPGTDPGWWRDRIHPDDRERVTESLHAVLADPARNHWEAEYRFRRGDGTMADVLDRGSVQRDASGRAARMIGAMLDVTSRKEAEAAVRRTREELQAVIDTVPSLLSFVDRDFIYRWNNRSYERWFERPLAEITGRHMRDSLGDAAFATLRPHLERALGGTSENFEVFLPYKNGKGQWIHAIYEPHRTADGTEDGAVIAVTDITERKRAEAAVVEAAEQRRLALEAADLGAWEYRFATGEILGDDRFFRMLGTIAEKLDYASALELLHPDDRASVDEAMRGALAGANDGKFRKEARVLWPDGTVRWIAAHGRVYFSGMQGARQPQQFIGVCIDITDRKRAMEELRQTTERFQAALRASPVVVFEQDRNLRYTWIHNSQIGLTTPDVAGKTDFELMERLEDAEANIALRREVMETGVRQRVEVQSQAGGRLRDYDITIEPRFDEAGHVVGVIGAAVDITQHKAAEEALRENREALSLALSSAKMGTWDWDVATGKLRWSDRTCELFGLPQTAVPDFQNFLALLHPDDRPLVESDVKNALAHEPYSYECEYRVVLPDGTYRWLFAQGGAHLDSEGKPARMLGVTMDVTDRVVASERLANALDAAEAANRAKDAFLAALSHELRTPLTPVLFLAATLERSPDVAPGLREDFAMIRRNIELEARLIDDLLDLTRITRGKLQLDLQPTDLHAVLERSIALLRGEIDARHLVVTVDLAATRHQANADSVRLQQVFWNVLKNAVKFTPEGGAVSLRSTLTEAGAWHLAVTDSGLGITAEEMPRIFEAFAQGEEASSHRFGGLGLGLAISGLLVREHGGRIWAESAGRNHGATFHIELPLDATPGAIGPVPNATVVAPAARSRRILLVEDHQPTWQTLERLLKGRGYEVTIAATAERARQLAATSTFDLMISDLGLPDGSGHDLAVEFVRDYGMKAIALSGYGMEEDLQRRKNAGFLDHLTKPIDIEDLHDTILRVLKSD
jgi:PAS domain S-box-containing protein